MHPYINGNVCTVGYEYLCISPIHHSNLVSGYEVDVPVSAVVHGLQ